MAIKILIVEECDAYVAAYRDQLNKLGYSEDVKNDGVHISVTVVDGKNAVTLAEEKVHFNVVICALDLFCDFNGHDVLRKFRECEVDVPFIMLVTGRLLSELPREKDLLERTFVTKKQKHDNANEVPTLQHVDSNNLPALGYALGRVLGIIDP